MSDFSNKDHLLGIFDEEFISSLKAKVPSEEFIKVMGIIVNHSVKAEADLSYDFNTAVNTILRRFPGKYKLTVSDVHQTLRDMGIIDYKPADFAYIEETLKRFGVLVEPDPSGKETE